MPAGRKTKYTPETIKIILDTIRIGGSDVDACARGNIDQATFYRWMQDKLEFREQVTRARWDSKVERIARIRKHGEQDWRADAWYLERRWPEEYAQQLIIKVNPEQAAILKKMGKSASEVFEELMNEIKQTMDEAQNG